MAAVILLVMASAVMFATCAFMGWMAYRTRNTPMAVFIVLSIFAFAISAVTFFEALTRIDAMDNSESKTNIEAPF